MLPGRGLLPMVTGFPFPGSLTWLTIFSQYRKEAHTRLLVREAMSERSLRSSLATQRVCSQPELHETLSQSKNGRSVTSLFFF